MGSTKVEPVLFNADLRRVWLFVHVVTDSGVEDIFLMPAKTVLNRSETRTKQKDPQGHEVADEPTDKNRAWRSVRLSNHSDR